MQLPIELCDSDTRGGSLLGIFTLGCDGISLEVDILLTTDYSRKGSPDALESVEAVARRCSDEEPETESIGHEPAACVCDKGPQGRGKIRTSRSRSVLSVMCVFLCVAPIR